MANLQEPKGVGFFSIRSGETHYAKMEAQIQAYINSSDMGINASRGQDYGWRLEAAWVKKVKEYRRDENKMATLTAKNGGQKVTTPQILYAIYGEQVRAFAERQEEEAAPFEEQYLQDISDRPKAAPTTKPAEEIPVDLDESDFEPAPQDTATAVDPAKEGEDKTVDVDKKANDSKKSDKKATQKQK